ncbi:pantetheine-phosphate adenylyltransferase [Candidatus Pantoea edessiphila]|uniref:Phosphopantetheine adenylyltransferase n=1 Tax=Candidatus Pantoea edessiphila TaxID=2044610 RepID=A0A2P5SXG5_9GAMM|nr:pantetheine-phosphate adenylyltransferase [Candidatus Pantoea edessiphila]MBK4775869.1 pantetheine-phosphate adenylyltransferase [Pantoea sp. Edef]PPI87037.1 pantetheine-phosphate adenylyltransferase [Candidatus Pantoea edessiphila]
MTTKRAIYPGTFDPITLGHLDIVTRAAKIFDYVIIGISAKSNKKNLFTLEERINLARIVTQHLSNITIMGFNGLLSHFAKTQRISVLIRGLRTSADFEYEMKLAQVNKHLLPTLESIFFITSKDVSFISSSLVKELAYCGGDVSNLLPTLVNTALMKKIKFN